MTDVQRQRELDALDDGVDPRDVLEARVVDAQSARDAALEQLRAVMSDEEAMEAYGLDLSQA